MSTYTNYKGLEKPLSTEKYDINIANKNNDVIDSELHKLDLKNESQDNLLATKESLNSEISRVLIHENEILADLNAEISRATSVENGLFNDIANEVNRAIMAENVINEDLTNHESSTSAHSDIRNLILDLTTRLDLLVNSIELLREDVESLK